MEREPQDELGRADGGFRLPLITVITLLAVSALLSAFSSASPMIGLGSLLTAGAAAASAFVCAASGWRYLIPTAVLSYIISLAFFGSYVTAASSLIFIPAVAVTVLAVKSRRSRASLILAVSAALAATFALYLSLVLIFKYGGLSFTSIKTAVSDLTASLNEMMTGMGLDNDTADKMLEYFKVLSPSFAVCAATFTAYFTAAFYFSLCRLFRPDAPVMPPLPWDFEMSIVSAVVFLLAYGTSVLFSSSDGTFLSLAADNLIVILTPGFTVIGARRTIFRVRQRSGGITAAVVAVIAFLLFFINIYAFLVILSFFGVAETIADTVRLGIAGAGKNKK